MNFEFPEEVQALRDGVREIVQGKVAQRAAEIDEKGEYPKDIEKLFADNGILAIPFPEEYGGVSGSSVAICMATEEIAKACTTSSLILGVQALGSYPILVAGSEEQKKRPCPPSTRCACRRPTGWAVRARASRSRWRCSTDRGPASGPRPWESPKAPSAMRSVMPRSASSSGSPSPASRASSSCSPTWRPRSRPPVISSTWPPARSTRRPPT